MKLKQTALYAKGWYEKNDLFKEKIKIDVIECDISTRLLGFTAGWSRYE